MYSTFSNIKESIGLAWKHKILWILSAMVLGAGLSSRLPSSGIFDTEDKDKKEEQKNVMVASVLGVSDKLSIAADRYGFYQNPYFPEDGESVTPGALTPPMMPAKPGTLMPTIPDFPDLFTLVVTLVLPVAVVFILVVSFWTVVSLLVKSWAKGALYSGLLKATKGEEYGFRSLGDGGRMFWRKYLKFMIYLLIIRTLSIVPAFLILGLFAGSGGFEGKSFMPLGLYIILQIVAVIWAMIFNISLYFVEQYSLRLFVTDGVGVKEAYKIGWKYYKTRPGKSIKLLLSIILLSIGVVVVLGIFVVLFAQLLIQFKDNQTLSIILALLSVPISIAVAVFFMVFPSYFNNVAAFSFTKLFLFIRESFGGENTEDKPLDIGTILGYQEAPTSGQVQ